MTNTKNDAKHRFLEKVARMYYVQGLSQQEIATEMNVGRSSVARFLAEARDLDIVIIKIVSPIDDLRNKELEGKLRTQFGLEDCLVTNGEMDTVDDLVVEYLDHIIPYKGNIGVTGGQTTYQLGQKLWGRVRRPNLTVVQMIGSFRNNMPETTVTKLYADALDAKGLYLPAPCLVQDKQSRDNLVANPSITDTIKQLKRLDAAIVGIGANDAKDSLHYLELFDFIDAKSILLRTIGDIAFKFFDREGNFPIEEINDRMVGITIKDYLATKQRIVIAYGKRKTEVLYVAVKNKLANIVITNRSTAQGLLNYEYRLVKK